MNKNAIVRKVNILNWARFCEVMGPNIPYVLKELNKPQHLEGRTLIAAYDEEGICIFRINRMTPREMDVVFDTTAK